MKKILLLSGLLLGVIITTSFKPNNLIKNHNIEISYQLDYCDGWADGYCEGWKDVKGQYSICPVAPVCPVPEVGQNTYRDGYNRGFKTGMRHAYDRAF